MANFTILPTTRKHIDDILPKVREADCVEFARSCGLPLRAALHLGFSEKNVTYTGFLNGEVVVIAGIAPKSGDATVGIPWMVTTEKLADAGLTFLRQVKPIFEKMAQDYDRLVNYVDAENTEAIRWIKWLGFTILDVEPFGVGGYPFHRFEMEIENNV